MDWLLALALTVTPALRADLPYRSAETCPITQAPVLPFVPPAPYPIEPPGGFWHGTAALWTMLDPAVQWQVGRATQLTQKVFWWYPGFNGARESSPAFTLTVRRLDSGRSKVLSRKATNASHASFGGSTILTGVKMPSAGCWEVTGEYRGNSLSFVVWVDS